MTTGEVLEEMALSRQVIAALKVAEGTLEEQGLTDDAAHIKRMVRNELARLRQRLLEVKP